MRNIFAVVLTLVAALWALDDATIPHIFTSNTPARAAEVNKNFDSLKVAHNRLVDSVDAKFVRKTGTASKIVIDTVISDSIYSDVVKAAIVTSDSARLIKVIADSIYSPKAKLSVLTSDSVYTTKIRSAGYGNISADSVYSPKAKLSTLTSDSVYAAKSRLPYSFIDTARISDVRVYGKSDSLTYAKNQAGTEYLLNVWRKGVNSRTLGVLVNTDNNAINSALLSQIYLSEGRVNLDYVNGLGSTTMENATYRNDSKYYRRVGGKATSLEKYNGIFTFRNAAIGNANTEITWVDRAAIDTAGALLLYSTAETIATPSGATAIYSKGAGAAAALYVKGGDGVERGIGQPSVVSGTFNSTLQGFTSDPSIDIRYWVQDSIVTLVIPATSATSDTNRLWLTSFPAALRPANNGQSIVLLRDNGSTYVGFVNVTSSNSGTMDFYINDSATGFTSSGTKGLRQQVIQYFLE